MIHMPDRSDVAVRLVPLEFRFRHRSVSLSSLCRAPIACASAFINSHSTHQLHRRRRLRLERVMGIEPT
jgi:hypothetical protein